MAPSSSAKRRKAPLAPTEDPLFQVDSAGSSSIRNSLRQGELAARHRRGASKPLRSDLILQERLHTGAPAVAGRSRGVGPSKERLLSVKERKRLESMVIRKKGKTAIGEPAPTTARVSVPAAPTSDAWAGSSTSKAAVKAPSKLREHDVLAKIGPGLRPVPTPHSGSSYNPTLEDHQALLKVAGTIADQDEEKERHARELKDKMDAAAKQKTKEGWELYEDEVGSGESGDEAADNEGLVKRVPKKKTAQTRKRQARAAQEVKEAADRRRTKRLSHALTSLPSVKRSVSASLSSAAALRAARLAKRHALLSRHGMLWRRPPQHDVQLTEDLTESGLRGLKTEGNLWREWERSARRRGLVDLAEVKAGAQRKVKGRKLKEVEKPGWRNFERWSG